MDILEEQGETDFYTLVLFFTPTCASIAVPGITMLESINILVWARRYCAVAIQVYPQRAQAQSREHLLNVGQLRRVPLTPPQPPPPADPRLA